MNDAGLHIPEQFADTGGFTEHVFAVCAILGYHFAPQIRDLPSKHPYAFNPLAAPAHLQALIGGKSIAAAKCVTVPQNASTTGSPA